MILIDLKAVDPSTMLTAAIEGQRLTNLAGQKYTVFTCDQQLYKILCDIKWICPENFKYFIPRLRGMHFLLSFIKCVGVLMQNTGFEYVMKTAFAGVPKMLSKINFPNNFRALRLVVEELFRDILTEVGTVIDFDKQLEDMPFKSKKHQNCGLMD